MSSPQIFVGSGTRAPLTFFHDEPSDVHGDTFTHSPEASASLTGPSSTSHGRAPATTVPMQWRTVSTTFALTRVPEHRTDSADGLPFAIATAWLVERSSTPPSTADAWRALVDAASVTTAATARRALRDTRRSP